MVLYYSLNCKVALDLPFWILSATMIGKTFHASIIIRQNTIFYCHRFCTASSERISPDIRGSSTVLYTPREGYGTRYHLIKPILTSVLDCLQMLNNDFGFLDLLFSRAVYGSLLFSAARRV